jgi:outer membrane protein OmpA-like peptidoglycan-associated protein
MKNPRLLVIAVFFFGALASKSAIAGPDQYDDSQSNPLRIAAYLLHPVGWLAEWTIFRPFHYIVSATEPHEAFFGHHPHPPVLEDPEPIYDYSASRKVPLKQAATRPPQPPAQLAAPETVKIVEVPVEKVVVKEVPKIVEVEKVVFPSVAFAFDSARLTDLGKGQVYLTAQRLKEKADLTVAVEGHTDNRGNDEYNQKLGLDRAQTIMNALADLGIDRNRISTASIGENKPLIDQDTTWARAVNRRVEFQVKAPTR